MRIPERLVGAQQLTVDTTDGIETGAALVAQLPWWGGGVALAAGLAAASLLLARCRRRLGGITGDVLGALVEVASVVVLVVVQGLGR